MDHSSQFAPVFALDARLAADTHVIGDLALCRVLLMNDVRFPWLVLVPRVAGARDWIDLPQRDRHLLLDEIDRASLALRQLVQPHKLNVATLGNVVAQLHVHVIARFSDDAAWPAPVWGIGSAEAYAPEALRLRATNLRSVLAFDAAGD